MNPVRSVLLVFRGLRDQAFVLSIEKIAEQMHLVSLDIDREFRAWNKFNISFVTGLGQAVAAFNGIVISQGNSREFHLLGSLGDLFRGKRTVRIIGVKMEVDQRLGQVGSFPFRSANTGARGAHQVGLYLVQNAVHEATAFFRGEFFGNVDCLIDAHHRRDVVPVKHLVDRESQDVSIYLGDSIHVPVFDLL